MHEWHSRPGPPHPTAASTAPSSGATRAPRARARSERLMPGRKRPAEQPESEPGKSKPRFEACEDPAHNGAHEELRKCRKDGLVRCENCRQGQKKLLTAVGSRGLDLAAHFRARRAKRGVEVVASSPEVDLEDQPDEAFAIDPAGPLRLEEAPTDVPSSSASPMSDSSNNTPPKKRGKKRSLPTKEKQGVCLHIGCDVCRRWYVVDRLLFEHWKDAKFTCCMIGETCSRKETHTALVSVKAPGALSRMGRPCSLPESRPQVLPPGCWDLWRPSSALSSASPRIFAAPMALAERRQEAQDLLFEAFQHDTSQSTIRELLGSAIQKGRTQRTAPKTWLVWQESQPASSSQPGELLSAAVLAWQRYTSVGPRALQGGMVLEYIAVRPGAGGKAYWLVLAAEEVALLMGQSELFSACDLNQGGQAFNGRARPALDAHLRWGFQDTDMKEWRDRRLEGYAEGCDVRYMVKVLGQ
ncbi:unnamed protein product [Effrenium voratum]|uniref:Uncharacterized protein n=1 Tax=Effrenium voratum TaxID=2562239 RepID=A0AA36HKH1_9DINO|nr:unnamed protein product [Effrenium voratum]